MYTILLGIYTKIFMKVTLLLWRKVYTERRQLVHFAHSFTTCQVLNAIASYEYQKNECVQQWNLFKCQTSTFYFSTYWPNLFEHIDTRRSDRMRDATAAIAGSVVKTTHRPGLFSSTTLSRPQANFLHQTCIAGLVKYLSPCTWRTSEWMVFGQSPFAQRKWITERCSNYGMLSPYLSLTNDVTVMLS